MYKPDPKPDQIEIDGLERLPQKEFFFLKNADCQPLIGYNTKMLAGL